MREVRIFELDQPNVATRVFAKEAGRVCALKGSLWVMRATHPGRAVMTYDEFFRERQNARYGAGAGKRC
ncbi:CstA-like transporter-associated (seleno)protein [Paraburkholderia humisilvae]|uniref:DUF466 domain-containing protein n=1 Tax=Paraburkholderia humisilvae TaxID=627669 RepID=A0A6J5EG83_9BURK|nr:hypothetical protein LMG29542_04883 [Paraburkholderia humisilvae]